jgi:hypothetical protein
LRFVSAGGRQPLQSRQRLSGWQTCFAGKEFPVADDGHNRDDRDHEILFNGGTHIFDSMLVDRWRDFAYAPLARVKRLFQKFVKGRKRPLRQPD